MTTMTKAATSLLSRVGRQAGRVVTVPLGLAVFAGVLAGAREYKIRIDVKMESDPRRKKLLFLPFDRMELVEQMEQTESNPSAIFGKDKPIRIGVQDLVDAIHEAANDPNVIGVYGRFGHGFEFKCGGLAHLDEVRKALKVFADCKMLDAAGNDTDTHKLSFAYSDTFGHPVDPANKEYYLASAFRNVSMQSHGELNLFGLGSSTMFIRSFLDKYGIKVHVFRHGQYKNSANVFTHKGFDRSHRRNVKELQSALDDHLRDEIMESRMKESDRRVWKAIKNFGTFDASQAKAMGFIDLVRSVGPFVGPSHDKSAIRKKDVTTTLPKKDDKASKKPLAEKETTEPKQGDAGKSPSDAIGVQQIELVSIKKYRSLLAKRKRIDATSGKLDRAMNRVAEYSPTMEAVFSWLGVQTDIDSTTGKAIRKPDKGKVAVVYVSGGIDTRNGRKLLASLNKIKKDENVKCVVLRVDSPGGSATASETMLQACNYLGKPVVCSMGNVAASGGYYIASGAERIFALPSTVTGSIGVFVLKFDITGFAKRYGIRFQHVETGPHSCSALPSRPLTPATRANFHRSIQRVYDRFKEVVSEGRGVDLRKVEQVAQGRVWTGTQALQNGLVDELGGLHDAIEYAKEKYATKDATIQVWPKPPSLMDYLSLNDNGSDLSMTVSHLWAMAMYFMAAGNTPSSDQTPELETTIAKAFLGGTTLTKLSEPMLAIDENNALLCLLDESYGGGMSAALKKSPLLPDDFWR